MKTSLHNTNVLQDSFIQYLCECCLLWKQIRNGWYWVTQDKNMQQQDFFA